MGCNARKTNKQTYKLISDVTTTIVVSGAMLFVIMAWIPIHFGRNPRNRGSPPKDNSDVNINYFISVIYLFVIMVWLMNAASDILIADPDVNPSVE
jgi:preprotein translocase subunit SecY